MKSKFKWIGERLLVCEPSSSMANVYSFRFYSPSTATWTPLEFTARSELSQLVVSDDDNELIFVEFNTEKRIRSDKQRVHTYRVPARYAFCSAPNFKMFCFLQCLQTSGDARKPRVDRSSNAHRRRGGIFGQNTRLFAAKHRHPSPLC